MFLHLLYFTVLAFGFLAPIGAAGGEISFRREIAPLLQAKCLACHNAEKAKGGYRLHTFDSLLHAGKSKKPPLVPGKPEQSELFLRIIAADPDDRMPQKDEPLGQTQIDLIQRWIREGANLDFPNRQALLASLVPKGPHPLPPSKYPRPVPIIALAFTPDGEKLAASGHHEVTFWNSKGECTGRLTNVPQRVRSLAFDPAAKFLAVAGGQSGRSGELGVYNLQSGSLETNLLQTADELLCVTFSADGSKLAAGGTDNSIHLFNWPAGEKITSIQQHADWVAALCFNSDGTRIASASRDRTARVYDSQTGALDATYTGQNAALFAVAFLSGGEIASGGRDKVLHLWSVSDGKKKREITGLGGDVYALARSSHSLFSASADGKVRQHSLSDSKLVRQYDGHTDAVYSLTICEPARKVAAGSYNGLVKVWNIDDGSLETTFVATPGFGNSRD
ncbi:MAG TPA: c-type cytochrome domain-containing protein [Verrucomicrobiae bacterium]|nr:c-type cytochrome domain-containing protein [Verrucomicrobiae bacterium]